MESDNSSVEAPKSPPVGRSPATEQTPPNDPKKTPETSPDKGVVASEQTSPRSDKIEPEKTSFAMTMPSTAYSADSEIGSVVKDATLDDDTGNDDGLSDPPDSISGMSDVLMHEGSQDEIVVGSANNDGTPKTESLPIPAEREVSNSMDVDRDDETDDAPTFIHPKRKRNSLFQDLTEDKMNKSLLADETDDEASPVPGPAAATRIGKTPRTSHGLASVKGVTIGYWRESKAPIGDKHIVKGFIDSRDRLRTRVQPCNRVGKVVTDLYPLNPGPGGSWVTFEKIVFDDHLVHLDQTQVKEYVKIRSEMDDPEGEIGPNSAAVQQAIARCKARGSQNEGTQPPQIAYGVDIPDHALHRPEKRRRTGGANSANATPVAKTTNNPSHPPVADLHGTRPTKILLGFWKGSAEPDDKDKHAVFGILGNNDMFRVKVGRETRDGRALQSNFPSGAGALWLSFDEYQIEDYLEGLSRTELKEYCRVRQYQIDHGERPEDKDQNRKLAIDEARRRIAAGFTKPEPREHPLAPSTNGGLGEGPYPDVALKHETPTHETRQAHARRSLPALVPNQARQSTQPPEFRAANRGFAVESRTNNLAVNAVARVEARQTKNDQREAAYMARQSTEGEADGDADGLANFQDNVSRLNRVWAAQEAHRMRANKEDAKIYMGIKYERKQTGPFEGKLVSQGTIISIDGEDYVEYRVLTKPTFF
ncbi:hypothetical protein DHEL01_v200819 [Diaporthe helianthi]|uniref:tRNA splicing endonuclease subunit n=1 Tax=Diaporthe helianthi TaxID=158607 RepID=A0A2P5IE41_DIAHE|nr:hypothetical protein DHEL01_v200819 [Diaporthe helianthi]